MTSSEVKRLVAMLVAAWPRQQVGQETLEVYALALADLDYELGKAAVLRLLQTRTFFPVIAEIREAAVRGRVSLPSPEEAWGMVQRAIGRIGSYQAPQFDCDEVQAATDAIGWRAICLDENLAATRARWIDAFKAAAAKRRDSEARGCYVAAERQLPAPGVSNAMTAGAAVLVETGYATPRAELALPPAPDDPGGGIIDELIGAAAKRMTRRLGGAP